MLIFQIFHHFNNVITMADSSSEVAPDSGNDSITGMIQIEIFLTTKGNFFVILF